MSSGIIMATDFSSLAMLAIAGSTTSLIFFSMWLFGGRRRSAPLVEAGKRGQRSVPTQVQDEPASRTGDIQVPSTYSFGSVRQYPKPRIQDWVVEIFCFIGYWLKSRRINGWRPYKTWLYGEWYLHSFMVPGINLKPRVVVSPLRAHGRALDIEYLENWKTTEETFDTINCASFDYGGFGRLEAGTVEALEECLQTVPHMEARGTEIIDQKAALAGAAFFGSDYCHFTSSGYTLNLIGYPAMANLATQAGKRIVILQDESNHNSMFVGSFICKNSKVVRFKHNSVEELEAKLKQHAAPDVHFIVGIEGNYSMEGGLPPLPAIVELKRRYHFQLYVDEAHSFLSIGHSGRGVIEHYNDLGHSLSWQDIDCYAVTLSKSAGNIGGMLVCNDLVLHESIQRRDAEMLATGGDGGLPTVVKLRMMQVWGKELMVSKRMAVLRQHTVFILESLHRAGLVVHSDYLSPVIVVITISATNCALFGTECTRLGLACTWAGPPATAPWRSVGRLCINALLTREDVEQVVRIVVQAAVNVGVASSKCLDRIRDLRYDFQVDKSLDRQIEAENTVVNREVLKVLRAQQAKNAQDGLRNGRIPQDVLAQGARVIRQQGLGSSSARLFWGTQVAHVKLEDRLASIWPSLKHACQDPHAMMLTDARNATVSTLSACINAPDSKKAVNLVLLPKERECGIDEAVMSIKKDPRVRVHYYENTAHIATLLERDTKLIQKQSDCYITVYVKAKSLSGEMLDLDAVFANVKSAVRHAGLTEKQVKGYQILLDESTTFGSYGPNKLGLLAEIEQQRGEGHLGSLIASLGGKDRTRFLTIGSLHHAFGLQGGFVVTDTHLVRILQWTSRAFIFTTAPMPFNAHMAHLCVNHLKRESTADAGYTVLGDCAREIAAAGTEEAAATDKRRASVVVATAGVGQVQQLVKSAERRKSELEHIDPAASHDGSWALGRQQGGRNDRRGSVVDFVTGQRTFSPVEEALEILDF